MFLFSGALAEDQRAPEKYGMPGQPSKLNIAAEELNAAIQEEDARAVFSEVMFKQTGFHGFRTEKYWQHYLSEHTKRS